MLKNNKCLTTPLTAVFFFAISGLLFNRHLPAESNTPEIPNWEIDVPLCYMQAPDGRRINLDKLCGQQRSPANAVKQCTDKITAADLPLANVNYSGDFLSGQVKNNTCKTVKYLKVNYQVLDEMGNIIDNGFIYAQPSTVPPGESASFRGQVARGAKVEATHVDWSE
ncbi:MAG: FxLYD domain-containing protein [Oscillatoriaceae bacterium SKW80]|nr:FxLYD domain-containing protein [Oscillatoriaceae bacterium SKYG93]MCX8121814.1 FxLYD domain-containing protein [Oscillatoriaceae bacterium SKW80]MDW8454574.1 FxLYD domain-containing protein [Oscillatoriaceae cyanobacterium SKYGB_i_bin93]HIK27388.1 hypothetical protein [Oscillatoriaceae cyanobacterium M7585_C2015_266]